MSSEERFEIALIVPHRAAESIRLTGLWVNLWGRLRFQQLLGDL